MTRYDRALAEQRRTQAIELRAAGHDYDSIAERLGYASRAGAWKCVQKALKANTIKGVDDLRAIETARLDAMQAAIWNLALTGDVRAVTSAVRIIQARCRLLGLVPDRKTAPVSSQKEGVVIVDPSQLVSSPVS